MPSAEYMRTYMREYRQGKRRGVRKKTPGSRSWLKARRLALGMCRSRSPIFTLTGVIEDLRGREESIGPQVIPDGMAVCPRCDILTRRRDVCGFCAAEESREGVAA